jgi:hypothetical protein
MDAAFILTACLFKTRFNIGMCVVSYSFSSDWNFMCSFYILCLCLYIVLFQYLVICLFTLYINKRELNWIELDWTEDYSTYFCIFINTSASEIYCV